MRQNKKQTDKVAIALVLCFCVVAIASVLTVKSGIDKLNNIAKSDINISDKSGKDVIKPVPTVDSQDTVPAPELKKSVPDYIVPVEGRVILGYSDDMPVYSKTLDQYMVHEGIDIAAPFDSGVKAISDGTVTDVFTDDKYGMTITIDHGDGLKSIYSNLSAANLVSPGDVVTKGQIISGIGETSLFEILDEAHLHFAMQKDSQFVDPSVYIKF